MSILNKIISLAQDCLNVFFPATCPVCHSALTKGQRYICTACRLDVPLTGFCHKSDNPMADRVRAIRPQIIEASSLIYYIHNSTWRGFIHDMKYREYWYHGRFLGDWLGRELLDSGLYSDVDFVLAVPLHLNRLISRGYNQSDYIAQGVAKRLKVPHLKGAVRRTRSNSAQAKTVRHERWSNVEGLFSVVDPSIFENRSVLLIDDVFTTGATIMSCAETILDAAPTCRLFIATAALSYKEFGVDCK